MTINKFARRASAQDIKELGNKVLSGTADIDYGTYNMLVDEFNFYHKGEKLLHIINNLGRLEMRNFSW